MTKFTILTSPTRPLKRRAACVPALAALLAFLVPTASHAQLDGLYTFDAGGDGTSWNIATNWERVLDPNGLPLSGNPATPPDVVTSADIPLAGVVIDGTMPGQTALDVNIGTAAGAGVLGISGGGLSTRDVNVGADAINANPGTLNVSGGTLVAQDDVLVGLGSAGTMTVSGGAVSTADDFNVYANSALTLSGGTLDVGDRIVLSDNASLTLGGAILTVNDDAFFYGNAQVTVGGGLIQIADKLRFDDDVLQNGKLTIDGGVVRSNEFGIEIAGTLDDFRGVVEINGDGLYQVELGDAGTNYTQLTLATAQALIAQGVHLTTSEAQPLSAQLVVVPEFFGRTDVTFVQIGVVPEPAGLGLMLIGLGCLARRRR